MAISNSSFPSRFAFLQTLVIDFLKTTPTDHLCKPQIDALLSIGASCHPGEIALVVLPTGCGKTGVAALAPYVLGVRNVLVLTPSVITAHQIQEAFCGAAEHPSFYEKRKITSVITAHQIQEAFCGAGEHPSFYEKRKIMESRVLCPSTSGIILKASQLCDHLVYNNELLVVNVHENRRKVRIGDINSQKFELVIAYEAHHYPAHMWRTVVDHFRVPSVRVLFLTATPAPIIRHIPEPCYQLSHRSAVHLGIIKDMDEDNIQEVGDTDGQDLETACLNTVLYSHTMKYLHVMPLKVLRPIA